MSSAETFDLDAVLKLHKDAQDLNGLYSIALTDDRRKWGAIRAMYEIIDTDVYWVYPVDWIRIFTPIEDLAWGEIRRHCLPMWPQYPVGRFFADFADPKKKIVIECDGFKYHDRVRDADRDREMAGMGWTVYRVPGADCKRITEDPADVYELLADQSIDQWEAERRISYWYHATVDGLIASIAHVHYGRKSGRGDFIEDLVRDVLRARQGRV